MCWIVSDLVSSYLLQNHVTLKIFLIICEYDYTRFHATMSYFWSMRVWSVMLHASMYICRRVCFKTFPCEYDLYISCEYVLSMLLCEYAFVAVLMRLCAKSFSCEYVNFCIMRVWRTCFHASMSVKFICEYVIFVPCEYEDFTVMRVCF